MVTKQEFEQSNKAQNERTTALENELINVNTSLESFNTRFTSFETRFTSIETMMQQVLTAVGKRPVVEPEPNSLLPTPGKHQTLELDEHTPSVEQNCPPGPRRFQSEDHAYWFDGGDNEVRNPYRPTRTYPRQPERDEFPRDFRVAAVFSVIDNLLTVLPSLDIFSQTWPVAEYALAKIHGFQAIPRWNLWCYLLIISTAIACFHRIRFHDQIPEASHLGHD
ncbi:hypothetical protein Q3G72_034146 [Acer saccharum]|nr:hypothetical protein Q3G72_034146 [Acer saccharum]